MANAAQVMRIRIYRKYCRMNDILTTKFLLRSELEHLVTRN